MMTRSKRKIAWIRSGDSAKGMNFRSHIYGNQRNQLRYELSKFLGDDLTEKE